MAYSDPEKARAYAAEYRKSHKEQVAAHQARYRSRPEYREREREAQRKRDEVRQKDPTFRAKRRRQDFAEGLVRYGLSVEDYARMLERQGCACAICRTKDPGARSWHVDHDHATGVVRGLLCHRCNLMLGHAKDSPSVLEAGAGYLRGTK
jgi:hypothetical protein